ncbi:MAG: sulfatase [Armatimonadetes bacterium]|nr:sulfatase [Armatimonadota bacterium]
MGAAGLAGGLLGAALPAGRLAQTGQGDRRRNVLFIAVDDLRPQLGCHGHAQMLSPNIDLLASRGTLFRRTYCQQAVCAPSRASVLTGCRPDTTGVHDLDTPLRTTMPDVVTLPQLFRDHGHVTTSLGKIYHHGKRDDPLAWSADPWMPPDPFPGCVTSENRALLQRLRDEAPTPEERSRIRGAPAEAGDLPDEAYPDGRIVQEAIARLRAQRDQPFFLAVGLLKPHLAFACPKRYWDLYSREEIDLADNPFRPKDAPDIALHSWGELRAYHGIPQQGPLPDEQARELIHGYYACVSFIDAQIGKLLGELDALGLRENTIVALWGDHGWNLGEHGLWCKHCNYETSVHSPLIISSPDQGAPGRPTDALTEFVDIYPTLAELAGLPAPEGLEGLSLAPLMEDPATPWKRAAFSQYPRGRNRMGYSMRTDRYRYTEWIEKGPTDKTILARELYDHLGDPGENVNVAGFEEHAALLEELSAQLRAGWRAALPGRA